MVPNGLYLLRILAWNFAVDVLAGNGAEQVLEVATPATDVLDENANMKRDNSCICHGSSLLGGCTARRWLVKLLGKETLKTNASSHCLLTTLVARIITAETLRLKHRPDAVIHRGVVEERQTIR